MAEFVAVLVADLYNPENATSAMGWTFWEDRGPALALVLVTTRHLNVLEGAGLVTIEKGYLGRRPRTWVEITERGRSAFQAEVATLRAVLDAAEVRTG